MRRRVYALEKLCMLSGSELFLSDSKLCCPVLHAEPGEFFTHRRHDHLKLIQYEVFEFLGRATGEPTAGAHATPKGRFLFRWDASVPGPYGIGDDPRAVNGGVRDACGAVPVDEYLYYHADGTHDYKTEMALDPEQVRGFVPEERQWAGMHPDEDEDEDAA